MESPRVMIAEKGSDRSWGILEALAGKSLQNRQKKARISIPRDAAAMMAWTRSQVRHAGHRMQGRINSVGDGLAFQGFDPAAEIRELCFDREDIPSDGADRFRAG